MSLLFSLTLLQSGGLKWGFTVFSLWGWLFFWRRRTCAFVFVFPFYDRIDLNKWSTKHPKPSTRPNPTLLPTNSSPMNTKCPRLTRPPNQSWLPSGLNQKSSSSSSKLQSIQTSKLFWIVHLILCRLANGHSSAIMPLVHFLLLNCSKAVAE